MTKIKKMGSIYYKDAAAKPGFTCYDSEPHISIGNTMPGNELRWVEAGKLLAADRCVCTNVSWNDLDRLGFVTGWPVRIDRKSYLCRCLHVGVDREEPSEWDELLDEFGTEDSLWHWQDQSFWGQETHSAQRELRILRGYCSARSRGDNYADDRLPMIGFRPVLEPLSSIPDDLGPLAGKEVCIYGPVRTRFTANLMSADEYDIIMEEKCGLPIDYNWVIRERGMMLVRRDAITWLKAV